MARCAYCESETELFNGGTPICAQCDNAKQETLNLRRKLVRDLAEATLAAEAASVEFDTVMKDIPSALPHPDGTQRIHNASHRMKIAREAMTTAQATLYDYLIRGIVPEDLKRSG